MEIDFDILPNLYGWVAVILTIYLLLYYKFVYSIIDPLFMWIFSTAFASFFATQVIPDINDIFHFFGCQISLWMGFLLAYRHNRKLHNDKPEQTYSFSNQSILRWTTYLLLAVYILSNVIIGYIKGFALFSDNPTESRFADFQGGFGLFRKINWATGKFVITGLLYMYLTEKKKKDIGFFLLVVFFSSIDGSKSALFGVIAVVGILFYHPAFSQKKILLKKIQRYTPVFILGAVSISFMVLIKEKGGLGDAYLGFVKRLLYSADSLLYFYIPVNITYFENYSFTDYITVVANPILGFLRLQPYQETVGNILYDNLRALESTDITIGPNAPFYLEGRIYFYFWGAFPFSLLLGYLYAKVRVYYFSLTNTSAFYFVYMATFCQFAVFIISDMNLAVTQLFGLAFFVLPPYFLVKLLMHRKFTVRFNMNLIKMFRS